MTFHQYQPYRTNSLALPSPKTSRSFTSQKVTTVKSSGLKSFQKPAMTVHDIKSPPTSTNLQNNRHDRLSTSPNTFVGKVIPYKKLLLR